MNDSLTVSKGKCLKYKKNPGDSNRIFVFDMDETIGSFSELYNLFKYIENIQNNVSIYDNEKTLLFSLLDTYPEFFRYGISILFEYLYEKKKLSDNISIYIYTNNSCIPISWTSMIVEYIEMKWNLKGLFDNIIRVFKIGNTIIENNRTTNDKTYKDLVRCIKLSNNAEICFIDNVDFPKMRHRHVYYLRPKPYYHYIDRNTIINRFLKTSYGEIFIKNNDLNFDESYNEIKNYYIENNLLCDTFIKSEQEMEIDILVSKKLLHHCKYFFYLIITNAKTKKKNANPTLNKTQKIIKVNP